MRGAIEKAVAAAIKEKYGEIDTPHFLVEVPENSEHGDYSSNAAFVLSGILKKPPMEIAGELAGKIFGGEIEKVEAVLPGFINLNLEDDFLASKISKIDDDWGKSNVGAGRTVIVEYFQLNVGKRPHVGHLRSAVIGDALKRMLVWQGYKAISDTHIGDWGTQFGILIYAYNHIDDSKKKEIDSLLEKDDPYAALEKLELIYSELQKDRLVKKEGYYTEVDPNEMGKKEFALLEQGNVKNREIWKKFREATSRVLKQSAEDLSLEEFDEYRGESDYEKDLGDIVVRALDDRIAEKLPDGAIVVNLSEKNLGGAVLRKSDGASTYLLRDLAAIIYRKKEWKFFRNIYVVDVRQSHHFNQLFAVADKLGLEGVGESVHVDYGFMSLTEGVISSRTGRVFSLKTLIGVAEKMAGDVIKKKNPDLEEKEKVAKQIALGAIKYFDLSHNRKSDIVFRWKDALSFDGDTGPYIQYTHARFKSILRKASEEGIFPAKAFPAVELDSLEHRLAVAILRFPEAIEDALFIYMPNILANYLYNLASLANEFYHSHPVIKELDADKIAFRLMLARAISQTLKNGLDLLGIDAPDKM